MSGRLFDIGVGVFCGGCDYAAACGAAETEHACAPRFGDVDYGGMHVVHPDNPYRDGYMQSVRGPDFRNVRALPAALPKLPRYLPQVRIRRGLRGSLPEAIYGIRAAEVIGKRKRLLQADAVRTELGLNAHQKLALIMFDTDDVLERIWDEADVLLPDLADARYDLVVSPSYSIYHPRPRLEHLYNFKRAFEIFARCQQLLIPAIPRGAWFIDFDVQRLAEWLNENRAVRWLAVDLQTIRPPDEWDEAVRRLDLLDQVTGRRLRYLLNGPSVAGRIADLYRATDPRRVSITNSTLASPVVLPEQLELPVGSGGGAQYAFAARCAERRAHVTAALGIVRASAAPKSLHRAAA